MTADYRTRLIECLQLMAERPALYIGNHDPDLAALWLSGFTTAVDLEGNLGPDERRALREAVWQARGWRVTSTSCWRQMKARGMTPEDMIAELIAIEIDVLNSIPCRPPLQS
jgi:hypothetical protein